MIHHYLAESKNPQEFLLALRSIIGHEMSHLINKDFLPTFLILTNQKVTNFVSTILHFIFSLIIRGARIMPIGSETSVYTMRKAYWILNLVITAFNRLVVYNLYEF
jgi:Zn-dependent protease with chaperone function